MTSDQEEKAVRITKRQLELSGTTLDAMRRAGLTDEREIQIDFFFNAPNLVSAKALSEHLSANDCLDLKVERFGTFLTRRFTVAGKTHATVVSPQVLAQWIPWMVVQGMAHNCQFDGWGADV
jgi:hypothetical protein